MKSESENYFCGSRDLFSIFRSTFCFYLRKKYIFKIVFLRQTILTAFLTQFFFFFKSTNLNSFTHWWEKKIVWKLKKSFLWKQLHFSEGKPFHDICQPTYVGRRQKPSTIVEKKHVLRCVLFPCFVHFRFPGDSQSRKLKNCSLSPLQNLCCFSSPVTDSGWD